MGKFAQAQHRLAHPPTDGYSDGSGAIAEEAIAESAEDESIMAKRGILNLDIPRSLSVS